ncbi:MAG: methionyl-tRNA formyltransferase [bacterium]|nr:methionyl-tRNA formyltransferase [bacterium]
MRLILLASGEFAVPTLRSLHAQDQYEIACVITQPDRSAGRGRRTSPTPVKHAAAELGLEVMEAPSVNDPDMIARVVERNAALGLVIAFGQKLGPALLEAFPLGCVNLHASLLPKYRGAAPFQWAVINGEERTGVTVFRLTGRMDGGAVLTKRWTYIKPEETAAELHDRLAQIGPDAVAAALEMFADGGVPEGELQDDQAATKAPKLTKQDGHITFDIPARELANRICGLWSWPGATCTYVSQSGQRSERVILARARPAEAGGTTLPPGQVDERLFVSTAEGYLELLELKPESSRLMTWPEFVNGRRVTPGDHFVPVD